MARQFDVKDEIEVKDDLDKRPDNLTDDPTEATTSEIDHKITRSVERFLAKFKTVDSVSSICSSPDAKFESDSLRWQTKASVKPDSFITHIPLNQILVVTNLARAGIDSLLAKDAK